MGSNICKNVDEKVGSNVCSVRKEPINRRNSLRERRISFTVDRPSDIQKKISVIIEKPQFKKLRSLPNDYFLATEFLMSVQKRCGFQIKIDQLKNLIPYQTDSGKGKELIDRIMLFKKLDSDSDHKLSLKEIQGLKKHLLVGNNFKIDLLLLYAYNAAINRGLDDGEANPTHVEFPQFRIVLVYLMQFFELINIFKELLTKKETEINIRTLMSYRILLEQEGFDMDRAKHVFYDIDTEGSGKVDLLEFLKQLIKTKTDILDIDPDADLDKQQN